MGEFDYDRFYRWEDETHIPEKIMTMINAIAEKVGCGELYEETIRIYNRGGYVCGYGKGFSLVHCTSSYETGPTTDYSAEMEMWLKGLGFSLENSFGDNGMDSATNYHDTYWTHQFIYDKTITWDDFYNYDDDDDDEC